MHTHNIRYLTDQEAKRWRLVRALHDYYGDQYDITDECIASLASYLGRAVPSDYVDFIQRYKSVEVELAYRGASVYLTVYDVLDAKSRMVDLAYSVRIANSIIIGDNGGGECFVYLDGPDGFGVYLVDFTVSSVDEAVYICESFTDLLSDETGLTRMLDN